MSNSEHSSFLEASDDSDYLYYSNDNSETCFGYLGNDGYYALDERDSQLVTAASAGNLKTVKQIIDGCQSDQKARTLNAARK
jgi:hypothetical protein